MECRSLRESGAAIREHEVALFAASVDRPDANRRFAASLELDYPILSDPGGETARAYGVARAFGLFASRHTFYIGADGRILFVDRDVSPSSAGPDLLARLEELDVPRRS